MQVRSAGVSDSNRIKTFLRRKDILIHRHLDWRKPIDWMGESPFLLLEKDREIQAILICPSEVQDIFWIRLFAGIEISGIDEYFDLLFNKARKWIMSHSKGAIITSIAYLDWMRNLLLKHGFSIYQNVVQLQWKGLGIPKVNSGEFKIRPMDSKHLPTVAEIDEKCFEKIWRHPLEAIKSAYEQTSYSTILLKSKEIAAFQMSTSQRSRAHIARLAVLPEYQGKGYGTALVVNMLRHFNTLRINEITVNTQENNRASLHLYKKLGFVETNDGFPILIHHQK